MGRKREETKGRGNPEEPDLSVRSNSSQQLRGRGGGGGGGAAPTGRSQYSAVHDVGKWVGCEITPCKPLVTPVEKENLYCT